MYRKRRVGLIVWGCILLVLGLPFAIIGLSEEIWIVAVVWLLPGASLLTGGIINAVLVTKHNNNLTQSNRGMIYYANCLYCQRPISVKLNEFIIHRNYPEGYVDCPFCKQHISRNAFVQVNESSYFGNNRQ